MTYIPHRVRDVLLSVKGITGIRICFDSDNTPFSFHAMENERKEIGYIIPDMGYTFHKCIRKWGEPATITSEYISLNLEG